jgi:hypothetical protein
MQGARLKVRTLRCTLRLFDERLLNDGATWGVTDAETFVGRDLLPVDRDPVGSMISTDPRLSPFAVRGPVARPVKFERV